MEDTVSHTCTSPHWHWRASTLSRLEAWALERMGESVAREAKLARKHGLPRCAPRQQHLPTSPLRCSVRAEPRSRSVEIARCVEGRVAHTHWWVGVREGGKVGERDGGGRVGDKEGERRGKDGREGRRGKGGMANTKERRE